MRNHFIIIATFFLSAALLLTGCRRDELAEMHNKIESLDLRGMTEQVEQMQKTLADLNELKAQLGPVVESLKNSRAELEEQLAAVQQKIDASDSVTLELNAELISVKAQIAALDAAEDALAAANLTGRIEELTQFINDYKNGTAGKITSLETRFQTFATLDQLALLRVAVEAIPDEFAKNFESSLEKCKDLIIGWVSDSQTFKDLFDKYYTKSWMDATLQNLDSLQFDFTFRTGQAFSSLYDLDTEIRKALDDAVAGADKELGAELDNLDAHFNDLDSAFTELDRRITVLEELFDVVGDYSNYKSDLITDIRELQKIAGENGTLYSLIYTLKGLLVSGEGTYYDLHRIVSDIAANTGNIGGNEAAIKALEELVPTLSAMKSLTELSDYVKDLQTAVRTNADSIAIIVGRVDAIAAQWTDAVMAKVDTSTAVIVRLKAEDLKLWEAIAQYKQDQKDADTTILHLIADINAQMATWSIGTMRDSVTRINALLENCGVGGIKGLQNNLDDLDRRLKEIWTLIGSETLDITGSIKNAINVIYRRFGELDGTLKDILAALNADLEIIRGGGWDADRLSLQDLKGITDNLSEIIGGKADTLRVQSIESAVAAIQTAIIGIITEDNASEKLAAYLLKADAASTYYTITAYTDFLNTYKSVVGDTANVAEGTVLWQLKFLSDALGSGAFTDEGSGNWAVDLTDAIKTLHSLVGDDTVSVQARNITAGLLQDMINGILGGEGSVGDIADSLVSFANNIRTLSGFIGEISKYSEKYPDITSALACLKEEIDGLDARYDSTYAELGHKHSYQDFTDFIDSVNSLILTVTGDRSQLMTTAQGTLVDAINELYGYFVNYHTNGHVDTLLMQLELALGQAIRDGDSTLWNTTKLNIDSLHYDIEAIVKAGDGVLDSLLSKHISALYENSLNHFIQDSWLADSNYIKHSEFDTAMVSALAALNVKFDDWIGGTYDYAHLDDAIEALCDTLKTYIVNYDNAKSAFQTLKSRMSAVESVIGEGGCFNATRTIKSVTDSLAALFGDLGGGPAVSSLLAQLDSIDKAIIKAILGKDGTLDDFADNNLSILKSRLDTLGFDKVLSGDSTLVQILNSINANTAAIRGLIGDGFSADSTVAMTIKSISDALGNFSQEYYNDTIAKFDANLHSLIDILAGQNGASISDIHQLNEKLNFIFNTFAGIKVGQQTALGEILNTLDTRIDNLVSISQQWSDTLGFSDSTFMQRIKWIQDTIDFLKKNSTIGLQQFSDFVKGDTEFQKEIEYLGFDLIGGFKQNGNFFIILAAYIIFRDVQWYEFSERSLKTDAKNLVGALNELQADLEATDLSDSTVFVTWYNLEQIKQQLTGGADLSEVNLNALTLQLARAAAVLGTKVEGMTYTTVWKDLDTLGKAVNKFIAQLGDKDASLAAFGTIWEALADLQAKYEALSPCQINNITYIPEYDDGMATMGCDVNRTKFNDMYLDFAVSASRGFGAEEFAGCTVSAVIRAIPEDGGNATSYTVQATATYENGEIHVTILKNKLLAAKLPAGCNYLISLTITDGNGHTCSSEFIPVYINDGKRIKSSDPSNGTTIKMAARVGGTKSFVFTPKTASDDLADLQFSANNVNLGSNNLNKLKETGGSGLTRTFTIRSDSDLGAGNKGNLTMTGDFDSYSWPVELVDASTNFTVIGGVKDGSDVKVAVGNTLVISFDQYIDMSTVDVNSINVSRETGKGSIFVDAWNYDWVNSAEWNPDNRTLSIATYNNGFTFWGSPYFSDVDVTLKIGDYTFAKITIVKN
ncbi:MAG: hypothetical protein MJY41_00715 [Bacteroidales bacterium]|nr:hypothetical protein [Bacteroidales bacterium]